MIASANPASAGTRLFGDDVLKRSPANDRKDGVVENEELDVAAAARDACADAADDDRDRERQEEQGKQELPGATYSGHARKQRAHGADSEVGERDAEHRPPVDPG